VGSKHSHVSMEEREMIGIMLAQGKSHREIGHSLGRHHTTIGRELEQNAPPIYKGYYLAHKAHERATKRRVESHQRPRLKNPCIKEYVIVVNTVLFYPLFSGIKCPLFSGFMIHRRFSHRPSKSSRFLLTAVPATRTVRYPFSIRYPARGLW